MKYIPPILVILVIIGFLSAIIYGMAVPYQTTSAYVKNKTWAYVITERYTYQDCGLKYDSDSSEYKYKCETKTKTVQSVSRTGTYKDVERWPEFSKKRSDSRVGKYIHYYVKFGNGIKIEVNKTGYDKYDIESVYYITTSYFGNVLKTERK